MKKIKLLFMLAGIIFLAGCGCDKKNQNAIPVKDQKNDANAKFPVEGMEKDDIQNIIGKVNPISPKAIEVATDSGEKITLKIPEKGASFMKQIIQADNSVLLEDVGLFDLPKDQNLEIKYNGKNDEVMLIIIK